MKLSHILVNLTFILFFSATAKAGSPKVGSAAYIKQENAATAKLLSSGENHDQTVGVQTKVTPLPQQSTAPSDVPSDGVSAVARGGTVVAPDPAPQVPDAPAREAVGNMEGLTTTDAGTATTPKVIEGRDMDGPVSDGGSGSGSGSSSAINGRITAATPPPPIVSELPTACNSLTSPYTQNLKSTCASVVEAAKACTEKYATSANICNTDTNPNMLSTMTQIQAMMSAVQGSGLTDACSSFSKAMNIGKVGMAAYTTYCGVQQKLCDAGCSKSLAAIESFENMMKTNVELLQKCSANTNDPNAVACGKDITTINGPISAVLAKEKTPVNNTIASKTKVCKVDMLSLMGMGLLNILSLAQAKSVSDQCEKQTAAADAAKAAEQACTNVANKDRADCACTIAANKTLSYCATGLVDCGLSENSDKPLCICKANPRMKGCEGVSTSLATNSTLSTGSGSGLSTSRTPGSLASTPSTAADATNLFPNKKGNGQDGIGSAAGGGSGGSGAGLSADSAGGGATDKASAAAAASKDSANVLESGGGGGGGYRGMGSSYNSPEYRSRLKAFADKNGIGSKIAGTSWGDQVTATGGKSNFDKIKTRYQENKSTLLAK